MLELKPALQASQGRSRDWSGSVLLNCFSEQAGGDKRSDFAVMATPGLTLWGSTGGGAVRGRQVVGGMLYVVSGNGLFSVDSDGSPTLLGTIGGDGPVRMSGNYTEVCIAAGGVGYVWSGGDLQTPVPFSVSDTLYADGYILWIIEDSEQFIISALDDALTYDAADIASVEGFPDNIVGAINDHREQQFFGENSTEIYYNSGNAAFPFERQGNAFIERGCFDGNSIVKMDNTVYFVGDDRIVYALSGYQPQRVSTHAIEYYLHNATYARAFTYSQEGHKFYCLEVDAGTWVFDVSTGAWHQRQSWGMTHWRVGGAVQAYGRTLLSDRGNGNLYIPDMDVFTENGEPIAVEITLPTIDAGRTRRTMNMFEVVCETGVGIEVPGSPDPEPENPE